MIVKITKGKGWRGAHSYISNKPGSILVCSNMPNIDTKAASAQIATFRSLRPTLNKAIAHFSLSVPPDDRNLTCAEWETIATEFLLDMGFDDCPHVVYRHTDTDHDHIHILALRINSSGETVSDKHDFKRAEKIARKLEQRHQLRTIDTREEDANNHKQRRPKMNTNETDHPTPDHQHANQIELADELPDKQRRNLKRFIREDEYEKLVEPLIGTCFKSVKRYNNANLIYLKPTGYLRDKGDSISAKDVEDELAAELMINLAHSRGWNSIKLTGSDVFLRKAILLCVHKGIKVIPRDEHQRKILDEILRTIPNDIGIATNIEDATDVKPNHNHTPTPLIDLTAEMLQKRVRERNESIGAQLEEQTSNSKKLKQ